MFLDIVISLKLGIFRGSVKDVQEEWQQCLTEDTEIERLIEF